MGSASTVKPEVSIIVPCYNVAWVLPRLARSLRPMLKSNVELIIVDDGSTDGSADTAAILLPTANIIRQPNGGLSAARNSGAAAASGEYLQFLDADDTLEPGKFEAQLPVARAHELDVVYSDWCMVNVKGTQTVVEPVIEAEAQNDYVEAYLAGWWAPPHAYLMRGQAYRRVGGNDESLRNTVELDLLLRMAIAGQNFGYVPGYFASYYRYFDRQSLSRHDARGYWLGCETIVAKGLERLSAAGELTPGRRRAAAQYLLRIAQNLGVLDPPAADRLLRQSLALDPDIVPQGTVRYRRLVNWLGLRRAERIMRIKRRLVAFQPYHRWPDQPDI